MRTFTSEITEERQRMNTCVNCPATPTFFRRHADQMHGYVSNNPRDYFLSEGKNSPIPRVGSPDPPPDWTLTLPASPSFYRSYRPPARVEAKTTANLGLCPSVRPTFGTLFRRLSLLPLPNCFPAHAATRRSDRNQS